MKSESSSASKPLPFTTSSSSSSSSSNPTSYLDTLSHARKMRKRQAIPPLSTLSATELASLRREHFGDISPRTLKSLRERPQQQFGVGKKASKYFEEQKEYLADLAEYDRGNFFGRMKDPKVERLEQIMIWLSFIINIFLVIAKLLALIWSGSLSIFASFLDSILDLLSGSIIFVANRLIAHDDPYKYPIGKKRIEVLSLVAFSAAMFAATGQVIVKGAEQLIDPSKIDLKADLFVYILFGSTIVIKFALWMICRQYSDNPSVEMLAEDHRNDVFSNGIGLATLLLGVYWEKLVDPIGGILIGIYIMFHWGKEGAELVLTISGKTADNSFLGKLTYIAFKHDPRVLAVDTVRAYHVSNELYFVEVDILLPKKMHLKTAHDIGESLQMKYERLPEVERAFVHLDYETEHKPEHFVQLRDSRSERGSANEGISDSAFVEKSWEELVGKQASRERFGNGTEIYGKGIVNKEKEEKKKKEKKTVKGEVKGKERQRKKGENPQVNLVSSSLNSMEEEEESESREKVTKAVREKSEERKRANRGGKKKHQKSTRDSEESGGEREYL